jgi:hypothetical protein
MWIVHCVIERELKDYMKGEISLQQVSLAIVSPDERETRYVSMADVLPLRVCVVAQPLRFCVVDTGAASVPPFVLAHHPPLSASAPADNHMLMFVEQQHDSNMLNTWIDLPLAPGNQFMIYRGRAPPIPTADALAATDFHQRYPVLHPGLMKRGAGIRFRSSYFKCEFEMEFTDGLAPCPAGHIWPKCFACNKFHFPWDGPSAHTLSKKHQKQLHWSRESGLAGTVSYYANNAWMPNRFL